MFDLPVITEDERKAANGFRISLKKMGFERCQLSVYLRFCEGKEQADTWTKRVRKQLPGGGRVYCLYFTDKQYESIVRFENCAIQPKRKNPSQFELF